MAVPKSFKIQIMEAAGRAEPLLDKFAGLLFADVAEGDFAQADSDALLDIARGRLAFLSERKPGRAKIAVTREGDAVAIDVVNDDMPFLVDSTLGLLNERGIEIEAFVHPVMAVKRDAKGLLLDLAPKTTPAEGFARESVMHVRTRPFEDATLAQALADALNDVRLAVLDWRAMQARVKTAISDWQASPPPVPLEELTEAIAFLQWLLDNHMTFLGMRDYAFAAAGGQGDLKPVEGSGLGILRDAALDVLRRGGAQVAISPEVRAFLLQPVPLIISKSDARSNVHRRMPMDYVGIKQFDASGELTGELRVAGLFTSSAYTQNPNDVPLVRRKLKAVIAASGHDPGGHSGKALAAVLESYPRDELFQIDTETLGAIAMGILRLEERPRARLFVRRDRFDRFVSAFVFIPRDRFNSEVRARIGDILAEAFAGRVASFAPSFGEGALVRVHFLIERGGPATKPDLVRVEDEIVDAVRSWDEKLAEAMPGHTPVPARWRGAFPAGYRADTEIAQAIADLGELERLKSEGDVEVRFARTARDLPIACHLRLYHLGAAIPLSDRLPILESMGLRSIAETTHELHPAGGGRAVIHEILLDAGRPFEDFAAAAPRLEAAFMAIWRGEAENDGFNALVLREGLDWTDAALLRAFARYLRQASGTYSPDYIAQTLVKNGSIARKLAAAFHASFDPKKRDDAKANALKQEIEAALANIVSLDEDRIVRRLLNLLNSILRTNFFQRRGEKRPATISFKIDSRKVEGLPDPKPFAEIFVYSPDVEGVHLRGGPVARGGLRWSDRPEDFRTEVLGLAKAQGVKNAVIVPVGAKGGFVPKKLPQGGAREAIQAEGTRAYKLFVSSLLDITDNIVKGAVVPPADVVRRDNDDPYLVVAADKGTATFSDTANGLSQEHGFWLDDAFASGGSAGYDHKKMGITARGAWEAVKRHFREAGSDIQTTPFTVIGVGDMSGDVFGNGMLLSPRTRLIAAFDHRDIFFDPDPDIAKSFAERARLFALPRSSWQDYDKTLVSKGGGIHSRAAKSIGLSEELRALTGLAKDAATPQEIIAALLRAPCDLLWFGGIGTYIKAPNESNADAGDRANDAIRADATELRAKAIGEGANLGVTQKGRIAFALAGGRINTDAVDNSAGVNSSDIEVNIKIALGAAEAKGKLTRPDRNKLLASMTDEVARLVLRNNYLQTLCLSLAIAQGTEENGYAIQLMQVLEKRGMLDRRLESLPSDAEVIARDAKGGGVTRPEYAVLMAYAKLALNEDLLKSGVPDDPYLARDLKRYFPQAMREIYAAEIEGHRLRREIVATMLANSMINRGGPSFVTRLSDETGQDAGTVARAFAVARDSFGFIELNGLVDALDAVLPGDVQLGLYFDLQKYIRWSTVWFLRHENLDQGLEALIARYQSGVAELDGALPTLLSASGQEALAARFEELVAAGVPKETAARLSRQRYLQRAPDAVRIAAEIKVPTSVVAAAVYVSSEELGVDRLAAEGGRLFAREFVERRAINRLTGQLFHTHRAIVRRIMTETDGGMEAWSRWKTANAAAVSRAVGAVEAVMADKSFDLARLAVAQGALSDLAQR
jgi:glutamate dehydrogenase